MVHSVKVVTRDALLGHILDAADRIRNKAEAETCNAQFTTERQPVLGPAVTLSKTRFKHRSIQIKGNFMKLNFHLYLKCIIYFAGLIFCSVYCQ